MKRRRSISPPPSGSGRDRPRSRERDRGGGGGGGRSRERDRSRGRSRERGRERDRERGHSRDRVGGGGSGKLKDRHEPGPDRRSSSDARQGYVDVRDLNRSYDRPRYEYPTPSPHEMAPPPMRPPYDAGYGGGGGGYPQRPYEDVRSGYGREPDPYYEYPGYGGPPPMHGDMRYRQHSPPPPPPSMHYNHPYPGPPPASSGRPGYDGGGPPPPPHDWDMPPPPRGGGGYNPDRDWFGPGSRMGPPPPPSSMDRPRSPHRFGGLPPRSRMDDSRLYGHPHHDFHHHGPPPLPPGMFHHPPHHGMMSSPHHPHHPGGMMFPHHSHQPHVWTSFDAYADTMAEQPMSLVDPSLSTNKAQALHEEQDEPVDVVPQRDAPPTFAHKNDYSQHFFDTNLRPQNFIRDSKYEQGFDEYPDLKRLIQLKDKLVKHRATPPMFLQCDLKTLNLSATLQTRFDVILLDPPWYEYHERAPTVVSDFWTAKEIAALRIPELAADQCYIFIWCGSADAIEAGRILIRSWGFRRCEDIVWIKTNKQMDEHDWEADASKSVAMKCDAGSICVHTKEHCLVGMKGTVKRNVDSHFIHANMDTDVIVTEEPGYGSTRKPDELYTVIEHFCNGRRRLELFGEPHNIRPGWITLGNKFDRVSNFDAKLYHSCFENRCDFPDWIPPAAVMEQFENHPSGNVPNCTSSHEFLLGSTPDLERNRPQSPPPQSKMNPGKAGGRGRGRGGGGGGGGM